jgi:hypothetical protein
MPYERPPIKDLKTLATASTTVSSFSLGDSWNTGLARMMATLPVE